MNLKKPHLALIVTALLGIGGTSLADTWDYKHHAGGQCQPFFGSSSSNYTANYFYNFGGVDSITCPVVRDSSYASTIDAGVTVQSNGGLLQCNFNSYNSSGGLIASVARYTYSTVPTNLYFSLSPSQVGFDGTFTISCYLPPSSYIFKYIVGEAIDTDDYN
ncbi:MAG TPA: hypothetical protein VKB80_01200 [Kofleriaceae bacterium]|nr:hypothetical protein [Kofleriaceae bacterium]